ncbi:hypothetical protein IWQ62_002668, partial [Dispira parvispora]
MPSRAVQTLRLLRAKGRPPSAWQQSVLAHGTTEQSRTAHAFRHHHTNCLSLHSLSFRQSKIQRGAGLAASRRKLSFQSSVAAEPTPSGAALGQLTYTIHFTLAFPTTHSSAVAQTVAQVYQDAQRAATHQYPIPTKAIQLVILPHRHAINEFIDAWNQVIGSRQHPGQGTGSCTQISAKRPSPSPIHSNTPIALEVVPPISSQSLPTKLTTFLKQHCQISPSAIRSGEGDVSIWLLSEETTKTSGDESLTCAQSLREILKGLDRLTGLLSGHVLKVMSLPHGGSLSYYGPLNGPHGEQVDLHLWLQGGYTVNTLRTQWKVLQRLVDQTVVSHPAFYASLSWQSWLNMLSRTISDASLPLTDRMAWAQVLHQATHVCPPLALTHIPSLIQCEASESTFGLTPLELLETWWQGWLHKFSRTRSTLGRVSQPPYEGLAQVVSLLALLIRRNIPEMAWLIWKRYQTVTSSEPTNLVGYTEHLLEQTQSPPIDQCEDLVKVIQLLGDKHPDLYTALERCLVNQLASSYAHPEQHMSSLVHPQVDALSRWLPLLPSHSLISPLTKAIRVLLAQQQYLRTFQLLWESSQQLPSTDGPEELFRVVSKYLRDDPANQWACQALHRLRNDWHKSHRSPAAHKVLFMSEETSDTVYGTLIMLQLRDPSALTQQLGSLSAVSPWSEPHYVHNLYDFARWVWLQCLRQSRRDLSGSPTKHISSVCWPSEFGSNTYLARLGRLQLVLYDYHRFPTLRGCTVANSHITTQAEASRDSERALIFPPIKKEWRHLLHPKRRAQDSSLTDGSIMLHLSWADYHRTYAQNIAPVDYCRRLVDEICLYAFTNEIKPMWAAYTTLHRWQQSQAKAAQRNTSDIDESQVAFRIDAQIIGQVHQVLLTLIEYQQLPLKNTKKFLRDFTAYLAANVDLRPYWLIWAGARLDQVILMGLLAKARLSGKLDPATVTLINQELSAQGSNFLVRCRGTIDTASTSSVASNIPSSRLQDAQALVDNLLGNRTT